MVVKCVYNVFPLAYLRGSTTLTIITLAITTIRENTQHTNKNVALYIRHAECCVRIVMLSVVMLKVVMESIVAPFIVLS
jgi:hypothetical protein